MGFAVVLLASVLDLAVVETEAPKCLVKEGLTFHTKEKLNCHVIEELTLLKTTETEEETTTEDPEHREEEERTKERWMMMAADKDLDKDPPGSSPGARHRPRARSAERM